MKLESKILPLVLLTGAIWTGAAGALHAENANTAKSMKPLEGVLFEAGTKRAVGYFYNEAHRCKLVLTVADSPISDDVQTFTAIRHEASVPAGSPTLYNLSEDKIFEFTCAADAQSMSIKEVERVAIGAVK